MTLGKGMWRTLGEHGSRRRSERMSNMDEQQSIRQSSPRRRIFLGGLVVAGALVVSVTASGNATTAHATTVQAAPAGSTRLVATATNAPSRVYREYERSIAR